MRGIEAAATFAPGRFKASLPGAKPGRIEVGKIVDEALNRLKLELVYHEQAAIW